MLGMAIGPIAVLLIAAHAGLGFTPLLMIPGVVLGAVLLAPLAKCPPAVQVDATEISAQFVTWSHRDVGGRRRSCGTRRHDVYSRIADVAHGQRRS